MSFIRHSVFVVNRIVVRKIMDISFLFKIAAIGLIVAVLNQMLSKAGREEYATLTVLTGIVVIIAMLIPQVSSLFSDIKYIFNL